MTKNEKKEGMRQKEQKTYTKKGMSFDADFVSVHRCSGNSGNGVRRRRR